MGSVAEAEVGGLYMNAQELSPMRTTLKELNHPQPPTPLKTDNSTADGIMNKTIKQRQSKAIDKKFFWLQDQVKQGEFNVFWAPGKHNLADYFTKYHSPATHKKLRPIYTYIKGKILTSLQGCIEILTSADRPSARPHSNRETIKPGKQSFTTRQTNRSLSRLDRLSKALKHSLVDRLA